MPTTSSSTTQPRGVRAPGRPRTLVRLLIAAPLLALLSAPSPASAQPDVHCEIVPLPPDAGFDLGGRFEVTITPDATDPYTVETILLVLDNQGEIAQEIPVQDGDIFQFKVRSGVFVQEKQNAPFGWLVHAPGFLFRTTVQQGFESQLAYCSPFAATRVDQPEDATFVSTTASPEADARLVIATPHLDPATIHILVDCVDVTEALGVVFPGGPFAGVVEIAGENVTVEGLVSDFGHNLIEMTLKGLPGGSHLVRVEGDPDYLDLLPSGSSHWVRPMGVLAHERQIAIFRVDIESPAEAAALPLAATTISGRITHAEPPTSLRVHGVDVPLPPATFVPGDGCVGDAYVVEFSTVLGVADIPRDLTTGDDALSALDPGVNFVSAIATDDAGHVPNDRVRFTLGDVMGGLTVQEALQRNLEVATDDCKPTDSVPGFVSNGFSVSLSERALGEAIRSKVLPDALTELEASLDALVGTTVDAQLDPCLATPQMNPARLIRYRGELYDLRSLDAMLGGRGGNGASGAVKAPRAVAPALITRVQPSLMGANEPPVIDPIEDQTTQTNQTVVVNLVANDPDGDPITFSLQNPLTNAQVVDARFEFHPACDQVGTHMVTIVADDGMETDTESFNVTVNSVEVQENYNAEFTSVSFDPSTVTLDVTFATSERVDLTVNTGPMVFGLHAGDCYGDCLIGCCVSWGVDFDVQMENVRLVTSLTPQQLLCGVADASEIPEPTVEVQGLDVDFDDVDIGGVFGWLTPGALTAQILDVFGVPELLLNLFADDYIVDQIDDSIQDAIVNQFPGFTFSGLREMEFSTDLPVGVPVSLATNFSDLPEIVPAQAVSMGIHTAFTATAPVDPLPPWHPTSSSIPQVGALGADFLLGTSDDALNQLMSELAAAGTFREQFEGFTVGDFVPGFSLPELGIDASTPILLTIDAAQNSSGDAIPPIVGFIDDPATPGVIELKVRTQFTARAILPRGGTVTDDRNVCSCLSFSCSGQPCLLTEMVLRLNFLVDLDLTEWVPGLLVTINLNVSDIQELTRGSGFDSFEASDFRDDEDEIVNTAATSPLLATLRTRINSSLPPLLVPPDALTLGDWVEPTNLRLFAVTVDDAGLGTQDYFGLLADVVLPEAQVPAVASAAELRARHVLRRTHAIKGANERADSEGVAVGRGAPGRGGNRQGDVRNSSTEPARLSVFARPNPFYPTTTIVASLPRSGSYALTIYDVSGAVVRMWRGVATPGELSIPWDGRNAAGRTVAPGVYVYHLQVGAEQQRGKLALVK